MRRKRELECFHRATTTYNNYGFPIVKPTDFWSNYPLELRACRFGSDVKVGQGKDWTRQLARRQGVETYDQATLLGMIPHALVSTIFDQANVLR